MTDRPAAAPRLEILRATDAHAIGISEFIRQVWDPSSTPESVVAARRVLAAQNVAEPGIAPPTFIALQAGRVLGYVTTLAVRMCDTKGEAYPAYLIKGLMVLPEFRSGPIGYHVLKAAVAELPRSAGLAVAQPALRLFAALGYQDFGAIPNLVRPLHAGRILQRIDFDALGISTLPSWVPKAARFAQRTGLALAGGILGGALVSTAAAVARTPAFGVRIRPFDPATNADALDALWELCRQDLGSAVVRDSAYLRPRYPAEPGGPYRWVSAYRGETLAGIAVIRHPRAEGDPRLKGVRIATLSDILYRQDDAAVGLALLGGAERTGRLIGGDALLTSSSSDSLRRLLRRQAYVPLGGNVHFLFRESVPAQAAAAFPTSLGQWYLTRGDGLADEIF